MSKAKEERDLRLAEALRANLRKRKAQDKAPPTETPSPRVD
jgi:hypothetical protein